MATEIDVERGALIPSNPAVSHCRGGLGSMTKVPAGWLWKPFCGQAHLVLLRFT